MVRTYFTTRRLCFLAEIGSRCTKASSFHVPQIVAEQTSVPANERKATTCDEDNMHEETSFPLIQKQQQQKQTFQQVRCGVAAGGYCSALLPHQRYKVILKQQNMEALCQQLASEASQASG